MPESMRRSLLIAVAALLCWIGCPAEAAAQTAAEVRLGTEVETPATFGFDPERLGRAITHAEELAPLNSLLIARGDSLVVERYFRGLDAGEQTNLKSASKSILSALVGIALEEGHLDSLDQPIAPFFPEILADAPPQKRQITLRDLLTMRAGLESTSFGNYGAWVTSDHWVRDALTRPLVHPPGTEMMYSTGTSHLVSAILTKATGMSTKAYAQSRLFEPLGIRPPSWQRDPQGIYFGGNNMALTPRAMLKIGQLYLNDGRYRGQQILPEGWAHESTRRYVLDTFRGFTYGYFWWIDTFDGVRTHFAWGYGGQYIYVVPGLDLVVACTSSLTNRPDGLDDHNERIHRLLAEYILPAVQR
jgi:CubicO group peptidase (beta-lactamase class C family)